jgi:hypothetical protein
MSDSTTNDTSTSATSNASHPERAAESLELIGHSAWGYAMKIVPATTQRDWMDATAGAFAYHCQPMALANQSGWFVIAPHGAIGEWDGSADAAGIRITITDLPAGGSVQAMSRVGSGILTWTIPYVFRTPPGWNLLCRGPANYVKDGVSPLEGLIETDWSMASFSMNWKFTRPGKVVWKAGEPVAMLVPHRRGDLELFDPRYADLSDNPELDAGYRLWISDRTEFLALQRLGDTEAIKARFQKHYAQGESVDGVFFEGHQKRRNVRAFKPREAPKT